MRELSLHILDVIENSIRAGASVVSVAVEERPEQDLLRILVEDNSSGLGMADEYIRASDEMGILEIARERAFGLNLFRAAAEDAAGGLTVGKSALGGAAVTARMRLSRLERRPLGDLAATLSSVVCTNPGLDLRCRISAGKGRGDPVRQFEVRVSDIAAESSPYEQGGLALARKVSEKIREGMNLVVSD